MRTRSEIKVLVVDDEPIIRMTAVDILEDAGFSVQEAGNSLEALQLLHDQHDFQVVFTDVNMPGGMDGLALAHHATEKFPGLGIVIVSGHLKLTIHQMPTNASFLAKPYEARHAVEHVNKAAALA